MDAADGLSPLTFGILHSPIALRGTIYKKLQVHSGVTKCMIVDEARMGCSSSDIRIIELIYLQKQAISGLYKNTTCIVCDMNKRE